MSQHIVIYEALWCYIDGATYKPHFPDVREDVCSVRTPEKITILHYFYISFQGKGNAKVSTPCNVVNHIVISVKIVTIWFFFFISFSSTLKLISGLTWSDRGIPVGVHTLMGLLRASWISSLLRMIVWSSFLSKASRSM